LPSKYVIHTVVPMVDVLTNENINELKSCYESCLCIASDHKIKSIAFCCISTGLNGFPQKIASIAVKTVYKWILNNTNGMN
jgi:O-acetyl-ADP-ribose deacetylase (regulator of RNase III)